MYRRILMPIDGSVHAERAMDEGLRLAAALGAEVLFLHAVEDPLAAGYQKREMTELRDKLVVDLAKEARCILDDALERAKRAGVPARARLVELKNAVDAILEVQDDVDLVVIGTQGRRGVGRWIFGSVAEGALRRSRKPFLVVRGEAESKDSQNTQPA